MASLEEMLKLKQEDFERYEVDIDGVQEFLKVVDRTAKVKGRLVQLFGDVVQYYSILENHRESAKEQFIAFHGFHHIAAALQTLSELVYEKNRKKLYFTASDIEKSAAALLVHDLEILHLPKLKDWDIAGKSDKSSDYKAGHEIKSFERGKNLLERAGYDSTEMEVIKNNTLATQWEWMKYFQKIWGKDFKPTISQRLTRAADLYSTLGASVKVFWKANCDVASERYGVSREISQTEKINEPSYINRTAFFFERGIFTIERYIEELGVRYLSLKGAAYLLLDRMVKNGQKYLEFAKDKLDIYQKGSPVNSLRGRLSHYSS